MKIIITTLIVIILIVLSVFWDGKISSPLKPQIALADKFKILSTSGNSSCSADFQTSIIYMNDNNFIRGSCCSPMSFHRYEEQIEGLRKYSDISYIPKDPYDVEVKLAKTLLSYYNENLSAQEQNEYDYAMQNSNEKGPCCCKCWRWYTYGGLGKYLIKNHNFTGKQLAEVWNLSDGCGGEGHHVGHS